MQVPVTVANRHSLITNEPAGSRVDGSGTIPVYGHRTHGPGEVVMVDAHEVPGLLASGSIVDPADLSDPLPTDRVISTAYDPANPTGIGLKPAAMY